MSNKTLLGNGLYQTPNPLGISLIKDRHLKLSLMSKSYEECFTEGSVSKAKFLEQHPEFKYGIDKKDPFYNLLMDADIR